MIFPIPLFALAAPTSRVPEMNLPSGAAAGLLSLRNTLSSDMSCEKLPPVIHFFRARYTNLRSLFSTFNFRRIFEVPRKEVREGRNYEGVRSRTYPFYILTAFPSTLRKSREKELHANPKIRGETNEKTRDARETAFRE